MDSVTFLFTTTWTQDITLRDTEVNFSDGDAVVVRNSKRVSIDAGPYDV